MDSFINEAVDYMINSYLSKKDKSFVLPSNPIDITMHILVLIYGETNIVNPYLTKSSDVFISNLKKYGASDKEVECLLSDLQKLYDWFITNKDKTELISRVQKDLIDLFIKKEINKKSSDLIKYIELLYVRNNPNPSFSLYNKTKSSKPLEIEKYLARKLDNPIIFEEATDFLLDENLYLKYGITLEEVKKLSKEKIIQLNDKINFEMKSDSNDGGRSNSLENERKLTLVLKDGFTKPIVLTTIVVLLIIAIIVVLILIGR